MRGIKYLKWLLSKRYPFAYGDKGEQVVTIQNDQLVPQLPYIIPHNLNLLTEPEKENKLNLNYGSS